MKYYVYKHRENDSYFYVLYDDYDTLGTMEDHVWEYRGIADYNEQGWFAQGHRDGVLWYPDRDKKETIKVEMYDVRAADDLVIWYDFERDGYVIERGEQPDEEVAFIRSWKDLEDVEVFQKPASLRLDPPEHDYIGKEWPPKWWNRQLFAGVSDERMVPTKAAWFIFGAVFGAWLVTLGLWIYVLMG